MRYCIHNTRTYRKAEDRESRRTHRTWCPRFFQPSGRLSVTSSSSLGLVTDARFATTVTILLNIPRVRSTVPDEHHHIAFVRQGCAFTRRSLRAPSSLFHGQSASKFEGGQKKKKNPDERSSHARHAEFEARSTDDQS